MSYTQPLLTVVLLLLIVGALRLPRGCPRRWIVAGICGLLLISWPPPEWLFTRPLEARYAVRPMPASPADAIVVLAGAVEPPIHERPFALLKQDTYGRCRMAAWLYKHWKPVPVLACGGGGSNGLASFAAAMREVLISEGVPEANIWTEEKSRSTHENALYGTEILRSHGVGRIALVVDARSMPRAAACFRKQGIEVVAAPSEFREWGPLREELLPSWKALQSNELTLHEMVGLVWYRLRGWI